VYNRILVALDGSSYSECIMQHVKAIASGCHVPQIDLLTVVEPLSSQTWDVPDDWKKSVLESSIKAARKYLAEIVDDLSKAGIHATAVVVSGPPTDTILDYVKKNHVDMVMMSSHGRSGASRFAFGSVADQYIRESPVPVFISTPAGCRVG
jgi:nucleotide-binding universal stress UspA family protein